MKIAVFGIGYVGLSNAVLLAQHNTVTAVDLSSDRVAQLNARTSPIEDVELEQWLATKELDLTATIDGAAACREARFIVIATPTDYDPETNFFNTSSVEAVIKVALEVNPTATIVVQSTVPVGFTDRVRKLFGSEDIIFCPEFLREGQALHDNLYPSRIVVGSRREEAKIFADLLVQGALAKDVPVLYTGPAEAESIKLFANTYLAHEGGLL